MRGLGFWFLRLGFCDPSSFNVCGAISFSTCVFEERIASTKFTAGAVASRRMKTLGRFSSRGMVRCFSFVSSSRPRKNRDWERILVSTFLSIYAIISRSIMVCVLLLPDCAVALPGLRDASWEADGVKELAFSFLLVSILWFYNLCQCSRLVLEV